MFRTSCPPTTFPFPFPFSSVPPQPLLQPPQHSPATVTVTCRYSLSQPRHCFTRCYSPCYSKCAAHLSLLLAGPTSCISVGRDTM